jgi:subtilisin family serine protease
MLSARSASRRPSVGCLLALTAASVLTAVTAAGPARADSVRDAQQWVLDAVNAPAAWPVSQGQGVLVAVIDSGVEPSVSDLAGSVVAGPDYSGVRTKPSDPNWGMHGTWMASLIAGHGHDGANGISGVAPKARVLSIRVLPGRKDPAWAQYEHEPSSRGQRALARAIKYAVAHRAGVISMSLGYGSSSRVVRSALQNALQHKVVVIASSGNSGASTADEGRAHAPYSFPADYPGVLGVAAVDQAGDPANFSSDNLSVQVAAPGVQVPAQGRDGQYWLVSGTSPACALTSGVAALIKSAYPRLSPALIVRAITSSARHRPAGGYDDQVGFGTVDAAAALSAAAHLASYVQRGHGLSPASHFGRGPAAIPPPPVQPRGLGQLVLFCLLAVACLALTATAASRLVLARSRGAGSPAALAGPEPAPARPAGRGPPGGGPPGGGPAGGGPPAGASGNGAGAVGASPDAPDPESASPADPSLEAVRRDGAGPDDAIPASAPPDGRTPGQGQPGRVE